MPTLRSLRLCVLAATLLAAGCSPAPGGGPSRSLGVIVVTAGGEALVDDATTVPPTLDLRITAGQALDPADIPARLDGRPLDLVATRGALTARVAPLPLGSGHRLQLGEGDSPGAGISFRIVAAGQTAAAVHVDPVAGTVLDLAFDLAPDHGAVEAALPGGGTRTWTDDLHLRVAWRQATGGMLDLPAAIAVAHGSHLAGPLHLSLAPVAPGTMRRATTAVPGDTAPAGPPPVVVAFSVSTDASHASLAAHAGQLSLLSPTGLVAGRDGSLGGEPDPVAVAIAAAHRLPLWPLVQNADFSSDGVSALLHDDAAQARLVTALRQTASRPGLGGIHLDFENVPPADRDLLSAFVARLAAGLHADGHRLAVAVVPHKPGHFDVSSAAMDETAIARAADLVTAMAYDQHTTHTGAGPVAGLDWDAQVLDGSLAAAPASRMLLGLPLYARGWDASGQSWSDGYAPALSGALAAAATTVDYDFAAATPFLRQADGSLTYLDDAASLAAKVRLAARRGLPGVAMWRLGFEDPALWSVLPQRPAPV